MLVEYGPGVGTFAREILRRMSADAGLIAIELASGGVLGARNHTTAFPFRSMIAICTICSSGDLPGPLTSRATGIFCRRG